MTTRGSGRVSQPERAGLLIDGGSVMLGEDAGEIGTNAALAPVGDPPVSKYERLIARAKQLRPPTRWWPIRAKKRRYAALWRRRRPASSGRSWSGPVPAFLQSLASTIWKSRVPKS